MRSIEIVYILNDRYWIPVLVSAKSALLFRGEHADDGIHIRYNLIVCGVDNVHLSVMREELTTSFSSVRIVEVSDDEFSELPPWHGSKLVWTRCYLDRILPDIQGWLCVCDGDTLWFRDPAELMNIASEYSSSVVFAGSTDKIVDDNSSDRWFVERGLICPRKSYSCLGFALIHVGRLAKFEMPQKVKCFLDQYGVPPWMEQDVFNFMFEGGGGRIFCQLDGARRLLKA